MKKVLLSAVAASALAVVAGSASAAIMNPTVTPVALSGADVGKLIIAQDIKVDSTADLTQVNMTMKLTSGSLYNFQTYDDTIYGSTDEWETDKLLGNPGANSPQDSRAFLGSTAGAGLGSAGKAALDRTLPNRVGVRTFGPTTADINWNDTATTDFGTALRLIRLSFTTDANGVVDMAVDNANSGDTTYIHLNIVNGVASLPAVPEPASLSLLGLGAMGLIARRRRA